MKFTLITAVLLCIGKSDDAHTISCCLTVTNTKIPVENIVNYDIQEVHNICGIRAVRFYTKKDKIICSNPNSSWAKKAMAVVNWRRKLNGGEHQTGEPSKEPFVNTSTANLIPTSSTTQWTTDGDGLPESCCNNVTRITKQVKSILKYHIKSRSKKGLRKFQAVVRPKKNSVDFVY